MDPHQRARRGIAADKYRIMTQRSSVWLMVGGRLNPGVTLTQARAELQSIGANLEREYPRDNEGKNFTAMASAVAPGQTSTVAAFLGLLMGVVGLVLLIACVNVAGILLARAAGRRREIAVRLAIGANRGRLIRQLLTETVILFAAGGLAGVISDAMADRTPLHRSAQSSGSRLAAVRQRLARRWVRHPAVAGDSFTVRTRAGASGIPCGSRDRAENQRSRVDGINPSTAQRLPGRTSDDVADAGRGGRIVSARA